MNIYTALKKDHDEVKGMLQQLLNNPNDVNLFKKLKFEMTRHNRSEEEAFYNPLHTKLDELGLVTEASVEEHELVDKMLDVYEGLDSDMKSQLIKIIKKSIEAHIDKEENEIFDLAKENLSSSELEDIYKDFNKQKEAF